MKLLQRIEMEEANARNLPVQYVCYHPIAEAKLRKGEWDEFCEPSCCAVDYNYDSVLREICEALGWQGGTIHQVVAEIKRLRTCMM